ncbi:triK protein [Pantoea stewartii]|uniref:triK protein n=1 Tax=Pantoea stewartii TaxID=66269 RepID=UPI002DBE5480|nr:triK protein [Pantoea stewartii]MEB6537332.1 triK protein [Pantoea stewartii]
MKTNNIELLRWVYENAYPNLTYLALLILAILMQFTFSGHVTKKSDLGAWDHIVMHMRTKLLVAYLLLLVLLNAYVIIVAAMQLGRDGALQYMGMVYENLFSKVKNVSAIVSIITVFLMPYFFHFIHRRYLKPRLSAFKRKYRVSQTGDSLSDIRVENQSYKSKTFEVRKYYKDGYVFMGLDEHEQPIYLEDSEFKSKNLKILGATQTGKGVIQQVLLDQAIMKGWGAWFFDQKPDDFIYSVLVESCKHWKRSAPVVLDLTGESTGKYSPFEYGPLRERLQRFNKVFGLIGKGTDADHYKNINRQIMTFLSDYWDGTLGHLDKLLNGKDSSIPDNKRQWVFENTINIRTRLDEWKLLPHLFTNKGEGFNVQKELELGSVVYVKGRQDDDLIRDVCSALLVEWKDCIINKKHSSHVFTCLDEAKFCISATVASALATILSKEANMALAYQERDDIKNVPDQTVDKEALKNQVETNTLVTISYKCGYDTAEWIANNTGTIQKNITRMEGVDTDGFGAESWSGNRMIGSEAETYISINSILSLNKRVGIFMNNEGLAKYIFTSWIPVSQKSPLPAAEKTQCSKEAVHNSENKNSSKKAKSKVIVNNEHKGGAPSDETDTIVDENSSPSAFDPSSDPDFIAMLEAQMANDSIEEDHSVYQAEIQQNAFEEVKKAEPDEQPERRAAPESQDDLISSFVKKDKI